MKYKLITIIATIFSLFLSIYTPIKAQNNAENQADIILFYGDGCPHCEKAKEFLTELHESYPSLTIEEFEIYRNSNNQEKMRQAASDLNIEVTGVPFIVVGENYVYGFGNKDTSGKEIMDYLDLKTLEPEFEQPTSKTVPSNSPSISLPFFGTISTEIISLPLFTILVAAVDGFNPCAMWTLVFLISLLIGMKDKKRMWFLGTLFIVTSAGVYFIFLAAWFNFFSYFAYITWIKTVIGAVALAAGGFYLKEAITNPSGACKVTNDPKRKIFFEKAKAFTQKQSLLLAMTGIAVLAIAVNIIELACSAGLPAVYTQVLSLSSVPTWQHYLYLLLYIFIFMLDDLFIFFAAMVTLKVVGIQGKYSQISRWVGGILLFIIGVILIIKPELLMIG